MEPVHEANKCDEPAEQCGKLERNVEDLAASVCSEQVSAQYFIVPDPHLRVATA
jgi:hypothetical protein